MGQKINPIGLRLGVNRGWDSTWFAKKDFGKYLIEDFKIEDILKNIVNSGVSEIIIERSSKNVPSQFILLDLVLLSERKARILKKLKNIMKITESDVNVNIDKRNQS